MRSISALLLFVCLVPPVACHSSAPGEPIRDNGETDTNADGTRERESDQTGTAHSFGDESSELTISQGSADGTRDQTVPQDTAHNETETQDTAHSDIDTDDGTLIGCGVRLLDIETPFAGAASCLQNPNRPELGYDCYCDVGNPVVSGVLASSCDDAMVLACGIDLATVVGCERGLAVCRDLSDAEEESVRGSMSGDASAVDSGASSKVAADSLWACLCDEQDLQFVNSINDCSAAISTACGGLGAVEPEPDAGVEDDELGPDQSCSVENAVGSGRCEREQGASGEADAGEGALAFLCSCGYECGPESEVRGGSQYATTCEQALAQFCGADGPSCPE